MTFPRKGRYHSPQPNTLIFQRSNTAMGNTVTKAHCIYIDLGITYTIFWKRKNGGASPSLSLRITPVPEIPRYNNPYPKPVGSNPTKTPRSSLLHPQLYGIPLLNLSHNQILLSNLPPHYIIRPSFSSPQPQRHQKPMLPGGQVGNYLNIPFD